MVRVITYSDPTRKCPMLDSYMGHAGAIGGIYVICIWGVTQMGKSLRNVKYINLP